MPILGVRLFDREIMTRTVWGEARGEGPQGMLAVAYTIINRYKSGRWFAGGTLAATALMPEQYSCWNYHDPSRAKLIDVDNDNGLYNTAYQAVAASLIKWPDDDPTLGATHYFNPDVAIPPDWANPPAQLTVKLGHHVFYTNVS